MTSMPPAQTSTVLLTVLAMEGILEVAFTVKVRMVHEHRPTYEYQ